MSDFSEKFRYLNIYNGKWCLKFARATIEFQVFG